MKLKRPNSNQDHYDEDPQDSVEGSEVSATDDDEVTVERSPPKRFAGKGKTANPHSLPILRLPNNQTVGSSAAVTGGKQVGGKRVPAGMAARGPVREESTTALLSRLDQFLPQLKQANDSINFDAHHRTGRTSLSVAEPVIIDQNDNDDDEDDGEISLDISKNRYARKGLIQEYHGDENEEEEDEEDIDEESMVSSDEDESEDEVSDFSDDDDDEEENDGVEVEMNIGIGLFNAPSQETMKTTMYNDNTSSYDINLFSSNKKNDDEDADTNSADILFRI